MLKINEIHRNCLFSVFCALMLWNTKNWQKYISTALVCLFYRSYFSFIMNCDANIHINSLFAQNDWIWFKKDVFYKELLFKPCSLKIKNLHRKLKYQKSKNMGLWQKPICRGPCFLKCKNVTGFPYS